MSVDPAARPLRIAFLTSTRVWRGSTSVFAVLARGLAARGHATTALVAHDSVAAGFRERQLDVRTLAVGHTNLTGGRVLRRALRELGSDVVLADKARDIRLAACATLGGPLRASLLHQRAPPAAGPPHPHRAPARPADGVSR